MGLKHGNKEYDVSVRYIEDTNDLLFYSELRAIFANPIQMF